jgi:hypothetical protein
MLGVDNDGEQSANAESATKAKKKAEKKKE